MINCFISDKLNGKSLSLKSALEGGGHGRHPRVRQRQNTRARLIFLARPRRFIKRGATVTAVREEPSGTVLPYANPPRFLPSASMHT